MDFTNEYILPEEMLTYLIHHECERSARYAHFFSILTVALENAELERPLLEDTSLVSTVAPLLRDNIRSSDMVGLIEDRSFVVLLHSADVQALDMIATRLFDKLSAHVPLPRIGRACFPTHAATAEDLILAAQSRPLEAMDILI